MYAIFESGGKQHRAEPGQRLALEKLTAPVGEQVVFDRVLLVRDPDSGDCRIGSPYVAGAEVTASVVAHFRDRKVIVFKRKRRKGYRKKQGHRQSRTQIRVEAIRAEPEDGAAPPSGVPGESPPAEEPPTEEPAAAETAPADGSGDAPAAAESAAGDSESADAAPTDSNETDSGETDGDAGEAGEKTAD